MRRYIDFRGEDWAGRADSRMQAARWGVCMDGIADEPPGEGVLNEYPQEMIRALLAENWVSGAQALLEADADEDAIRQAVLSTLEEDLDCLASTEYTLVERMLIGGGETELASVAELEAGYTLRMRLWCDLGMREEEPSARMDPQLCERIAPLLMRREHADRRARIFVFEGMAHGILYMTGALDAPMASRRFIAEVLRAPETEVAARLARNFLEASFDVYEKDGRVMLVHEALADPEPLLDPARGGMPSSLLEFTPGSMAASMNGLLPQESAPNEKLRRALYGALRPEYDPSDATSDLRYLSKQGAPLDTLKEIMAGMLVVMPTAHMNSVLGELRHHTARWVEQGSVPPAREGGAQEFLH